jgi:hypothetical protein
MEAPRAVIRDSLSVISSTSAESVRNHGEIVPGLRAGRSIRATRDIVIYDPITSRSAIPDVGVLKPDEIHVIIYSWLNSLTGY